MDTRSISCLISISILIVLSVYALSVDGTPVKFENKPPMCPYGKCYIDRCQRICLCVPNEGNVTCTKDDVAPIDCPKLMPGNCPLGKQYKSPLWTDQFVCFCNNDASQTYECFDLSKQKPAEAQELLNSLRRGRNKVQDALKRILGLGVRGVH